MPSPSIFRISCFVLAIAMTVVVLKENSTCFGKEYVTQSDSKPMRKPTATFDMTHIARSARSARSVAAACCAAILLSACQSATTSDHPLRDAASTVGWATTTGEPADFVRASRNRAATAYIPVGREGPPRPTPARTVARVRDLEGELDRQRDASEGFARRQLPSGAYGQPLPSVAAPPRSAQVAPRPGAGQPESYPVNPNRVRQMRENARNVE
jgi:hypothetical protein